MSNQHHGVLQLGPQATHYRALSVWLDTTIYHVRKGYAISAIVTELKMKLTFY